MSEDGFDLTGEWWGNYSYPRNEGPTTPFIAKIADHGGTFHGTIIEPDTLWASGTLEASITGVKHGSSLDFIKTYAAGSPEDYEHPIDYVGSVSAHGNVISGVWSMFDSDGTFEMMREAAEQMTEEQSISIQLEVPNHSS